MLECYGCCFVKGEDGNPAKKLQGLLQPVKSLNPFMLGACPAKYRQAARDLFFVSNDGRRNLIGGEDV